MKLYTKIYSMWLIQFLLISCSSMNNQLRGQWLVEEIYQKNKNLLSEKQWITSFTINDDGTCELPIRDLTKSNTAYWTLHNRQKIDYLIITGAKDNILNGQYKLSLFEKHQLNSKVKVMELQSNELYLKCTQ